MMVNHKADSSSRYKAGQKEATILKRLQEADPLDKKHIVRMDRTFEHRGHLCLVFESLRYALFDPMPQPAHRFAFAVSISERLSNALAKTSV